MDRIVAPSGVVNYFYKKNTGHNNLQNHLHKLHHEAYDDAIMANNWNYKTSIQLKTQSADKNPHTIHNENIPAFLPATFLDMPIYFILLMIR